MCNGKKKGLREEIKVSSVMEENKRLSEEIDGADSANRENTMCKERKDYGGK